MNASKRIAVIGAGASGLAAIKCLKEDGHEPVCFEKTDYIGGLWKFHEKDVEGVPSVPWYTFMDHSKEMWAFSDFPPKKELPNFMRHTEIYEYLHEYAQHFDLMKYINFQKEVIKVSKSPDFVETGRWQLILKDTTNQRTTEDVFDGVLICSGHLWYPYIPSFLGKNQFRGKIMHTHNLKKVDEFSDKTVLVIGTGSSGLDAAVEISNVAKQVHLSTRSGSWVMPRLGPEGLPMDVFFLRRWHEFLFKILPEHLVTGFLNKNLSPRFNHDLYNLKPNRLFTNVKPVINESIALKISSGTVSIKGPVKKFTTDGVMFSEDGKNETIEVDVIILATGYRWKFPFLEQRILDVNGNNIDLYKCVYPPQLKHPTLAFIGFIKPIGPTFPVFELQCRWASRLLSQKIKLPSRRSMMLDIAVRYQENTRRFGNKYWVYLMTDYISYMQDISAKIGARPKLLKLFFVDPKLFWICFFGPALPYQFRLEGPNVWNHAKQVIFGAHDRIKFPFHTKSIEQVTHSEWSKLKSFFFVSVPLVIFLVTMFLRTWKKNSRFRYYLIMKLFPYVNMIQQLVYEIRNYKYGKH